MNEYEKKIAHNAAQRKYATENKAKIAERQRLWRKNNPKETKRCQIKTWKARGVVCEDFSILYDQYIQILNCDACGVGFGKFGDGTGTYRVLDHCHETGEVRNYLCQRCNIYQGYIDNANYHLF